MSKTLFALIFSIILFQCVCDENCVDKAPDNEGDCQGLTTSALSLKCVYVTGEATCKEVVKDCAEINAGATDDLCKQLKVNTGFLCLKNGEACQEKQKCNLATGNDDAACKNFPVETTGNVCKKDTAENSNKCKEVREESTKSTESKASTQSGNNLTFSLAFLILLFLF